MSSPVFIDNGKAECRVRPSSRESADGISKNSITPGIAIQNYDPTSDKNATNFLKSGQTAPNSMVPTLCKHTVAGENVVDKDHGLSDKISSNSGTLQFSAYPDDEINLLVDLNCTPSTWYTEKYNEDMPIPSSTDHSESTKFSKIIVSLVSQDDLYRTLPSSSTISRPSAAALPGTLVEVPGSHEGIQVLPSDVQCNIKPDTMAGALDDKALSPENVVIPVRSERCNAPLTDGFVQSTSTIEVMSQDETENCANVGSIQNVPIAGTDKVPAFPLEDMVIIDSNENTLKESAGKQETVDVPTGAPHNNDVHEVPMERVPVAKAKMEEADIGCGDRFTDSQLDDCSEDRHDDGDFNLIDATPSCDALAPGGDYIMKNTDLEMENKNFTREEGSIPSDQFFLALQMLQKKQDEIVHMCRIVGDITAQADMDIQTIMIEGEMTPKVKGIKEKYEKGSSYIMELANSSYSEEGRQTINVKRRKLEEGIPLHNKCQDLDKICRDNNWILPRYEVLPSRRDGMCRATVYLFGPDFQLRTDGYLTNNPREARESAAAYMICLLYQKVEEERAKCNQM